MDLCPFSVRCWLPKLSQEGKNWWWNVVILLGAIVGLYVVFHFRPFRLSLGSSHPLVGQELPRIKLEAVEENQPGVSSEALHGQVVLVCFWGPWSEMSRRALPRVAELAAPYMKRPDFRLISIACAQEPSLPKEQLRHQVRSTLREWGISVPTYIDPEGETLARFRARQGLEQLPTLYLVDRQGKIQAVWPGFQHQVEKELQELLEESFPEPIAL
ncbi:MAG: TlpA family protein disulfide reductase [Thermoguttaceae bacterium]|nr:TlpA family protein disulfide reductase [Thermoguttaceae bacterium]MDW8039024.1 TlpA disulfide reductase family protein [Thermoguttaceae bacterium]